MKPPIKIWRSRAPHYRGDYHISYNHKPVCTSPNLVDEYILTTAIKDLPEDKLAELGVMRIEDNEPPKGIHNIYICPKCGDSGETWGTAFTPATGTVRSNKKVPCPCLKNPNSIASIKRGGSDNG